MPSYSVFIFPIAQFPEPRPLPHRRRGIDCTRDWGDFNLGSSAKRLLTAEDAEDAELKAWIQRCFLRETPGFSLRSQRTLR